jgi:hypothetical protein
VAPKGHMQSWIPLPSRAACLLTLWTHREGLAETMLSCGQPGQLCCYPVGCGPLLPHVPTGMTGAGACMKPFVSVGHFVLGLNATLSFFNFYLNWGWIQLEHREVSFALSFFRMPEAGIRNQKPEHDACARQLLLGREPN